MESCDGSNMVKRLTWIIGLAAIVLAMARLTRLLDGTALGPPWAETLVIATGLGVLVTLATESARGPRWSLWLLNGVGAVVLALRVIDSASMTFGLLPTQATFRTAAEQMEIATQLIRFGAAPVVPVQGVVALLAILFWALGALVAFGAVRVRPALSVIPPLGVYLQFATFDRRPPGSWWVLAFLLVAAAALAISAPLTRTRLGRARFTDGDLVPRRSSGLLASLLVVSILGGLLTGTGLAASIAEAGLLGWRTNSGIGTGLFGTGSVNVFVGLQQQLVDLSDEPVFYARFSENAPPNRELYWKLITLDRYDGEFWRASEQTFSTGGASRWERPDWKFSGPTSRISARVQIAALKGSFLPTIYSPVDLSSEQPLIQQGFRVREDGSVAIDLQVIDDWIYQFQADVPIPDIGELATDGTRLSPIFEAAVADGAMDLTVSPTGVEPRPDTVERFVDLPDDVREDVLGIAERITENAATPFEEALLLESFFRDPDQFEYSTEVSTGHSSLDLVDWIIDPDSPNYRIGYCEQFATAMGVLGRALGIPSRIVVGFTPGEVQNQDDGTDLIVVRERNSHAWVEMWMDGQGWVRFDPTPRSDGVNPSLGGDELGFDARTYLPAPDEADASSSSPSDPLIPDRLIEDRASDPVPDFGGFTLPTGQNIRVPWWVAGVFSFGIAAGLVPAIKALRRRRRLKRILAGDVDAAWREIVDRLTDLGDPPTPAHTPLEIATRAGADLVPLADRYGEAAYGGHTTVECAPEFERAEDRLREDSERFRWLRSWLSPRSLFRR